MVMRMIMMRNMTMKKIMSNNDDGCDGDYDVWNITTTATTTVYSYTITTDYTADNNDNVTK